MKKSNLLFCLLVLGCLFIPEAALAQVGGIGGSGLESKIKGLTQSILTVILPSISVLGLMYSAMLAATGDQSARPRMTLIIFASVVGMLAPVIVSWLQRVSGF